MEWGDKVTFLTGIAETTGDPPAALLSQPRLSRFEQAYFSAFDTLAGSRQWTMGGPAAIPLSEIAAYFEIHGINDPDEREDFITLIQGLDAEYLRLYAEKHGN